jgi:hypothetical protein
MPTLDWIGKKAVINHHNEVPFSLLSEKPDLSVGDPDRGNLLAKSVWKSGFGFTTTIKSSGEFFLLIFQIFTFQCNNSNGNQ